MLLRKWGRWVVECIMLLDGDGTFRHWKYPGAYNEQPWIDIQIFQVIRGKWVEMKNEEMKGSVK